MFLLNSTNAMLYVMENAVIMTNTHVILANLILKNNTMDHVHHVMPKLLKQIFSKNVNVYFKNQLIHILKIKSFKKDKGGYYRICNREPFIDPAFVPKSIRLSPGHAVRLFT